MVDVRRYLIDCNGRKGGEVGLLSALYVFPAEALRSYSKRMCPPEALYLRYARGKIFGKNLKCTETAIMPLVGVGHKVVDVSAAQLKMTDYFCARLSETELHKSAVAVCSDFKQVFDFIWKFVGSGGRMMSSDGL
ncbi:hypothetical protein P8H26_09285 [Pseudochrobactrum sp. sp1633]|uniref:hypothetical protein n=1 Tax=Pseudochrobactrum sp. sp1633 TaxID=3036706 RepID=UPI0025A54B78|nr:hypothetical protein [Pseudochrobactrum sp. sp1633]MDM8345584.1 hypothetical protein [Pseudochrobactrum sp. sp1633]